jgi:hypothetical protein
MIATTKIPVLEQTDMEVLAIERGLLRLWHNDQLKLAGNKILEIGCNESLCSQTLGQDNYVVGIDVRPYHAAPYASGKVDYIEDMAGFMFIQGDASQIRFQSIFDLGIAISSVEHFGCGEYGDFKDEDADIKAMKNFWNAIKPKGVIMVTLPIFKEFRTELGYIRQYSKEALKERIIQGNKLQRFEIITHPGGPDFVGGAKAFDTFDFSDITYKADIYLEMVKGE